MCQLNLDGKAHVPRVLDFPWKTAMKVLSVQKGQRERHSGEVPSSNAASSANEFVIALTPLLEGWELEEEFN